MDTPLIVVTDRHQAAESEVGHGLVDVVAAAVAGGADTVWLREKDLPADERARLAEALLGVLCPVGGRLLVGGDAALARSVGAAGVHCSFFAPERSEGDHSGSRKGRAGRTGLLVGRSCHSLAELRAASVAGDDYATLSPIWASDSKPRYGPPLGTAGLAEGCRVPLPVYALGGVVPGRGRVAACRGAGARGVAVMGATMRADDPTKVVRMLLDEWA